MYKEDNKSFSLVLFLLLLFVPILDFILYAKWKRTDPQAADFILGVAIVSTILYVIAGIIIGVVLVVYDVNSPPVVQYISSNDKTIINSDDYSNNSNPSITTENSAENSDISETPTDSSDFNSDTSDTVTLNPNTETNNTGTESSDTPEVSSELDTLSDSTNRNTSNTEQNTSDSNLTSESTTTSNNTTESADEKDYDRIAASLIMFVSMCIGTLIIQKYYQKENDQYSSPKSKQNNKQRKSQKSK